MWSLARSLLGVTLAGALSMGLSACGDEKKSRTACLSDPDCGADEVCNLSSGWCEKETTETIVGPEAPTYTLELLGPTELTAGTYGLYRARWAESTSPGNVTFKFSLDGTEVQSGPDSSWSFLPADAAAATHTVTVKAVEILPADSDATAQEWEATAVTVSVTPMETTETPVVPPTLTFTGPAVITAGTTGTFEARAPLPAGAAAVYFRILLNGVPQDLDATDAVAYWVAGTTQGDDVGIDFAVDATAEMVRGAAHTITAQAALGATGPVDDEQLLSFNVAPAEPTITVDLRGPAALDEGEQGTYIADLTITEAPEDTAFEYQWLLDDQILQAWSTASIYRYTPAFDASGTRVLKVQVTEDSSLQRDTYVEDTLSITVTNVDVVGVRVGLNGPLQAEEGGTYTYTANAFDPDDTARTLYYRFSVTTPGGAETVRQPTTGAPFGTAASWNWIVSHEALQAGDDDDFTVKVAVAANADGPALATETQTVHLWDVNRAPTVALDGPATIEVPDSGVFHAIGGDDDAGDQIFFTFELDDEDFAICDDGAGGVVAAWDNTYTYNPVALDAGTHVLRVFASNACPGDATYDADEVASATHTFTVTVLDTDPEVDSFTVQGVTEEGPVSEDFAELRQYLMFEVEASDAENDPMEYEITLYEIVNGTDLVELTGSTTLIDVSGTPVGTSITLPITGMGHEWDDHESFRAIYREVTRDDATSTTELHAGTYYAEARVRTPGGAWSDPEPVAIVDENGAATGDTATFEITEAGVTLGGATLVVLGTGDEDYTAVPDVTDPVNTFVMYRFVVDGVEATPEQDWGVSDTLTLTAERIEALGLGDHTVRVDIKEGPSGTTAGASDEISITIGRNASDGPDLLTIFGPTDAPQKAEQTYTALASHPGGEALEFRWLLCENAAPCNAGVPQTDWLPGEAVSDALAAAVPDADAMSTFQWGPECLAAGTARSIAVQVRDPFLAVDGDDTATITVEEATPTTVTSFTINAGAGDAATPVAVDEGSMPSFEMVGADECDLEDLDYLLTLEDARGNVAVSGGWIDSSAFMGSYSDWTVPFVGAGSADNEATRDYKVTLEVRVDATGGTQAQDTAWIRVSNVDNPTEATAFAPGGGYNTQTIDEGALEHDFRAYATDDDQEQVYFKWVLDLGEAGETLLQDWTEGVSDGGSVTDFVGYFTWEDIPYDLAGPHTVTVMVRGGDSGDAEDSMELEVTVRNVNQAPEVIAIAWADNDGDGVLVGGESVTVNATAEDLDAGETDALEYRWRLGPVLGTADILTSWQTAAQGGDEYVTTWGCDEDGVTYTLWVEVRDPARASDSFDIDIDVEDITPASIVAGSLQLQGGATTIWEDTTQAVFVEATEGCAAETDAVEYKFEWTRPGTGLATLQHVGQDWTTAPARTGIYIPTSTVRTAGFSDETTIRFIVHVRGGGAVEAEDSASLDIVVQNPAPVVEWATSTLGNGLPLTIVDGASDALQVAMAEADDDTLTYTWFVDGLQVQSSASTSFTFNSNSYAVGTFTVSVEAEDADGLLDTLTHDVSVVASAAPVVLTGTYYDAVDVPLSPTIRILFDQSMDNTDLATGIVAVTKHSDGSAVAAAGTAWDAVLPATYIDWAPDAPLEELTQYDVTVSGAQAVDGTTNMVAFAGYSFTTGDFTAPTVTSTTPADDATGVTRSATGNNVVIVFGTAMDPDSALGCSESFITVRTAGGAYVPVEDCVWSGGDTILTMDIGVLEYLTDYDVDFNDVVTDANGVQLDETACADFGGGFCHVDFQTQDAP